MTQAFIIMNIGQPDLDLMCSVAIVPALQSCGLEPKRVDKHNQGGLLKSEIIKSIQESEIIIADLTNERPNCYLEVGYAMGIDKFKNLILTVREDHNQDSPDHVKGGPKIHFDLSGYEILFWRPDALEKFRDDLTKRIQRRLSIITNSSLPTASVWDNEWITQQTSVALGGLAELGFRGGMIIKHTLSHPKPKFEHRQLLESSKFAEVHTFGWPLGIVTNKPEFRPRPTADGVYAEVKIKVSQNAPFNESSYDYWAIRKNGDYYLLESLFEDERHSSDPGFIFYNIRIMKVTEAILHCARLYSSLGVDPATNIHINIEHTGLKGRLLCPNYERHEHATLSCKEDSSEISMTTPLSLIERDIVSIVKSIVKPLPVLFEFFELQDEIYEKIIDNYIHGKIN
jgi:hypothetical protein